MNKFIIYFFLMLGLSTLFGKADTGKTAYDFSFKTIDGKKYSLAEQKGKVILIVNVASNCGFTPQYTELQNLWKKYQNKKFILIGVPSNDFFQERGSNSEIKNFCETNFNVTFPIMEKVSVRGSSAHPFYQWAKESYGIGAIPQWNFHKILIDSNGKVVDAFLSTTTPESDKIVNRINELLAK